MTPDATACPICVCARACHDSIVKPSRIKDQTREQEEQRLLSMKTKKKVMQLLVKTVAVETRF